MAHSEGEHDENHVDLKAILCYIKPAASDCWLCVYKEYIYNIYICV